MKKLNKHGIKLLSEAGVKIVELHINNQTETGHVVIADIVHCSSGGGKEWIEEKNMTLRSNDSIVKYIDDIS